MKQKQKKLLIDGIPCHHKGCLGHVSHPCEECGRVAGIRFDHNLKILKEFFQLVFDKVKTFEIRKNDRNYKVGDRLLLREWDEKKNDYTGRIVFVEVTYMTSWGQPKNQVVMAIRRFI